MTSLLQAPFCQVVFGNDLNQGNYAKGPCWPASFAQAPLQQAELAGGVIETNYAARGTGTICETDAPPRLPRGFSYVGILHAGEVGREINQITSLPLQTSNRPLSYALLGLRISTNYIVLANLFVVVTVAPSTWWFHPYRYRLEPGISGPSCVCLPWYKRIFFSDVISVSLLGLILGLFFRVIHSRLSLGRKSGTIAG